MKECYAQLLQIPEYSAFPITNVQKENQNLAIIHRNHSLFVSVTDSVKTVGRESFGGGVTFKSNIVARVVYVRTKGVKIVIEREYTPRSTQGHGEDLLLITRV